MTIAMRIFSLVKITKRAKLAFNTKTDNLFVLANLQRALIRLEVSDFELASKICKTNK